MVPILLLFALLFQTTPESSVKPVVDNERVTVLDVPGVSTPQSLDAVVVSLSGSATFVPKGTTPNIAERSMLIQLKDHPVPPLENKSGYPLAFPRPGSKKLLENDRVIVWEYTWTTDVPTPMHFHDKDVVVVFFEDGDLKSTTPDGKSVVNSNKPGTAKFSVRDRTHFETLIRGKQHAIMTELK